MRAVLRNLGSWKGLVLIVGLVLLNGAVLSRLGVLSYSEFSWEAFAQSYNGEACGSPTECVSGFCVDGVCCNMACVAPGQSCTTPGNVGVCVDVTPSPVLSLSGNILAALTVLASALLGWRLRTGRSR